MKQKVLFIATVLRGHILVFHLPYMQWFQQQGYEVHCCAGNDTTEANPIVPFCDCYHSIDFARNPLQKANINAYRKLKKIIDREQYTLIHCHTPVGGMLGRLASRNARKQGTRVCYTAHGFHFFSGAPLKNWFLYYTAEKYLSRYTDLLITINQEDYLRAKKFKAKQTALISGVGVELTRFTKPVDKAAIRDTIGISKESHVIMTVGEHTKRKNHAVCIQALKTIENADLVFCGVGEQEKELTEMAVDLQVSDRVHFLGFRKDVAQLLRAADIFVFPSLHEGLPVALMEAMAAGLPCVVSNVRGNTDLIQNGEGGYLFLAKDVTGMTTGLKKLLNDTELCIHFGERNKEVIKKYGLENVLEQMAELYQKQLAIQGDA